MLVLWLLLLGLSVWALGLSSIVGWLLEASILST